MTALHIYTPKAYSRPVMARLVPDVERFLPLTPVVFEILIALAAGDHHGYSVMQDVERRSEGRIVLHPGTLYRALGRLLDAGFIEELDERPAPDLDDQRRRYYRLAPLGQAVARAEAERLASQVTAARRLLRRGPA
jgi:DNA-binding PadR family transcriptional regulator